MKKLYIALSSFLIVLMIGGVVFRRDIIKLFAGGKKEHPGKILTVETPSGKESVQDAEDVPLKHRFVFLKDGHEVKTREQAEKIIPIVRVDIFRGPDGSVLEMHEQGPNGESLRRSYGEE